MKIKLITNNDCCVKVMAEYTPLEWLIAHKALKQFINNPCNHVADRTKAEKMDATEIETEEHGEEYRCPICGAITSASKDGKTGKICFSCVNKKRMNNQ